MFFLIESKATISFLNYSPQVTLHASLSSPVHNSNLMMISRRPDMKYAVDSDTYDMESLPATNGTQRPIVPVSSLPTPPTPASAPEPAASTSTVTPEVTPTTSTPVRTSTRRTEFVTGKALSTISQYRHVHCSSWKLIASNFVKLDTSIIFFIPRISF